MKYYFWVLMIFLIEIPAFYTIRIHDQKITKRTIS